MKEETKEKTKVILTIKNGIIWNIASSRNIELLVIDFDNALPALFSPYSEDIIFKGGEGYKLFEDGLLYSPSDIKEKDEIVKKVKHYKF